LIRFLEFVETCPVDQSRWIDSTAESCNDCLACLEKAQKRIFDRAKAQRAALEDGMTLDEATEGTRVVIQQIKVLLDNNENPALEGLSEGAIVEIETQEQLGHFLNLNVNGYHVKISRYEASQIFVKPV